LKRRYDLASPPMNSHAQVQQGNVNLRANPRATFPADGGLFRGRPPLALIGAHYDVIVMDRQLRNIRI
jgi:hypothetical protein